MSYFVLVNGEQTGPVGRESITSMLKSGAINGDSLVWYEGIAGWTPLRLTELVSLLESIPEAPSPQVLPPGAEPKTESVAMAAPRTEIPTDVLPVELKENRRWWGFKGSIGRKDYVVNFVISFAAMFLFVGILFFGVSKAGMGVQAFSDRDPASVGPKSALFVGVGAIVVGCMGMLFIVIAGIGNMHRRIKDIRGKKEDTWLFTAVAYILSMIPYVQFIVVLIVMCMPGRLAKFVGAR